MTYLERVKDFLAMQEQGQTMEAFEKYYADNCTIIEMPTGEKRVGKDAQRKVIQDWFGDVQEVHGGGFSSITVNEEEGITSYEGWTDVTFKGMGRMTMQEVGVQKWDGDQIVEEKFYYNAPPTS